MSVLCDPIFLGIFGTSISTSLQSVGEYILDHICTAVNIPFLHGKVESGPSCESFGWFECLHYKNLRRGYFWDFTTCVVY
jgi:hypothetical protein